MMVELISYDPLRRTVNSTDLYNQGFESLHYSAHRKARIQKLEEILGATWWRGKTILELACGFGHTGNILQQAGAIVTFTEGRPEYLNQISKRSNGASIYCLDQDFPWNLNQKFDLVIHWGILYHLQNWKQDLITALQHGKLLSLDTEVTDSDDPEVETIRTEGGWFDQAINGIGIRPSVGAIEKVLKENAVDFTRYDDAKLNGGVSWLKYDWRPGQYKGQSFNGLRRFWLVEC